jgi:hypothetical protein
MGINGRRYLLTIAIVATVTPSLALPTVNSIDTAGIDALKLHRSPYHLTGKKIAIGQVEIGRPGKFGWDKAAQNIALSVEQVFHQNRWAQENVNVDRHATMVASVMVSRDSKQPGVAPGARLYSTAVGNPHTISQPEECLSAQHIAQQNGGDVRTINISFGEPLARDPRPQPRLDGNALFTQCLDWSSRVHNVLYVVAGNQGKGGISIPTDNYNGVNVAYSTLRQGVYQKVDFGNLSEAPIGAASQIAGREVNVDNRRSIGLVAPGGQLRLYDLQGKLVPANGSSFAAPHVTGTIALLQEFGDRQLRHYHQWPSTHDRPWTLAARNHEVMKAVLLNSADKIQDRGDGLRLGMSRTLLSKRNRDWLESDAYRDPHIPMDYELGTGHLNAVRAYQQFSPGQWRPDRPVPPIGWDYSTVKQGDYRDYILDQPLREGSFVSITLAWDRLVELATTDPDGKYDLTQKFVDRGLNNLELYLMYATEEQTDNYLWSSTSKVDSVEHIFYQVRDSGKYKIRVYFKHAVNQSQQKYALAWWTVN